MIPVHCSQVSLQEVSFELDEEAIEKNLIGKKLYHRTQYLVLKGGTGRDPEYAVIKVIGSGYGVYKNVEGIEVISLPSETGHITSPQADAFNHNSLSKAAEGIDARVVVIETEFDHITFLVKEEPIKVNLVDVVPPNPSKLLVLAQRALETMTLTKPIEIFPKLVDMTDQVKAKEIIYPCRAKDMGEHQHAKFLHECPQVGEDGVLVGCDISKKIFFSEYNRKPRFVNICPKEFTKDLKGFVLMKCCLVEDRVEIEGNRVTVPWGAKLEEIREAIRWIIDRSGNE